MSVTSYPRIVIKPLKRIKCQRVRAICCGEPTAGAGGGYNQVEEFKDYLMSLRPAYILVV